MDTRTIYLLTPEAVYSSDPSENGALYMDVSEYDNLNPTRGTIVSGTAGAVATYEPYEATMVLTYESREARAAWIQQNGDRVYQIAVANTINKNRVYNKRAAITGFEFLDNEYINGIQTKLTLKLFGKWQSTLTQLDINTGTYEGGTKEYTTEITDDGVAALVYTYDNELAYGTTVYTTAIELNSEHGFVMVSKAGQGLTLTLTSSYNSHVFQLESNWPNTITGLSTNFVAYPVTAFTALNRFTILSGGTMATYGWNIEQAEFPYLYDALNNVDKYPVAVGAVDQTGKAVPVDVFAFTQQDFI